MGYIYDAMKQYGGASAAQRQRKKGRPPAAPTPSTPTVAPVAPVASTPIGQQPPPPLDHTDEPSALQGTDVLHKFEHLEQHPGAVHQQPTDVQDIHQDDGAPASPIAFDPITASIQDRSFVLPKAQRLDADVDDFDDRLVAMTEPASIMSEEYRAIRTGILARWEHKRHLVHTITSATPQEGKTITSLNLGVSFAELRNRRTVVVEADLRLPQFTKLLAIGDRPGLATVLENDAQLSDVVLEVGQTNLHMIVAGHRANDRAVQLLHSAHFVKILQQLRQQYDHVIVDTPPVVELADAGIIGSMSDDVQLIVRMDRTPKPLVEQAIRTLDSYNAPVAGLIATDQARHRGRYYYKYGYRYRYRYRYADKQAA